MHELMFAIAAMLPKDKILEDIRDAAQECLIFPNNKEKEDTLQMHMTLLAIHLKSDGEVKNAMNLLRDMEDKDKKLSLFETNGN